MNTAPCVSSRSNPAGELLAETRQVVVAKLIDGDEQHEPHFRLGRGGAGADGRRRRLLRRSDDGAEREKEREEFSHRTTSSAGRADGMNCTVYTGP